jgi:hypothetical protein
MYPPSGHSGAVGTTLQCEDTSALLLGLSISAADNPPTVLSPGILAISRSSQRAAVRAARLAAGLALHLM